MALMNKSFFVFVLCFLYVVNCKSFNVGNGKGEGDKEGAEKLVTMYENSMPSVMGMLPYNKTLELLLTTFLSDKKDDSIWPHVIKETKVWFGRKHDREELEAMEKRLTNYRSIIQNCHKENTGVELTKCLSALRAEFTTGEGDFIWEKEQDVPLFLNFYEAFHLMKLASLQLIKIQKEKDDVPGINIDQSIRNEAEAFSEQLKKGVNTACEQRIEKITAVKICKVVDVLWEEFTDICEERLKRSIDEEESDEDNSGDDEKEDEITSRSDVTEGEFTKPRLGGDQSDFTESIRCTVKDKTTKQFVYNRRLSVTPNLNKAKVVETLYNEAVEARGDHVKRVEKACVKYWEEHGTNIAKQIEKLVDMPKKKANKKKGHKKNGQ